jgi:predicted nucleic acid-binding protein
MMRRVFADSVYWIAVTSPGDQWGEHARTAYTSLGNSCVWTTEEVLTEFLAALSAKGPRVRSLAVSVVERVFRRKEFFVLPQTHHSFLKGLSLYKRRPDKRYSLVDCISMEAMRAYGLREALTNDLHFTQEGFVALMRG